MTDSLGSEPVSQEWEQKGIGSLGISALVRSPKAISTYFCCFRSSPSYSKLRLLCTARYGTIEGTELLSCRVFWVVLADASCVPQRLAPWFIRDACESAYWFMSDLASGLGIHDLY